MATSEHGTVESPMKSAFSLEYYDSTWERDYMTTLEKDPSVDAWTKNHGIRILYFDENKKVRTFAPDFLIRRTDGTVELHEIKGGHLLRLPETKLKIKAGEDWCKVRKMLFRVISRY
jgi:hypothetical protein